MSDAVFDRVRSALGDLAQDAAVSHGVLVVNAAPAGVLPLVLATPEERGSPTGLKSWAAANLPTM